LRPPRRPKIRAKIKNRHGKYRARVKKLIKPSERNAVEVAI